MKLGHSFVLLAALCLVLGVHQGPGDTQATLFAFAFLFSSYAFVIFPR